MRLLKVATCNLNQWAMDFDCNMKNIKESIARAKEAGAVIRLGPELEITGYGCEDHFLELDTITHAWECLKDLLLGDWTDGILCSFGMPVINGSERYNCQVLCLNRKIIMIRPKLWLANDGNYRELRWFTAWKQKDQLEDFLLPHEISEALCQKSIPFGYGFIQFLDTIFYIYTLIRAVAVEVCEELFTPIPPHADLALNGVEVFMNASGSHHQLRKLDYRIRAFISATHSRGGVYMYSNQQGCDGGRLYFDGCSCVVVNGDMIAQGSQFSLRDVEVVVAQVDLDAVAGFRGSISSFQEQASCKTKISSVAVQYSLCQPFNLKMSLSGPLKITYHSPEEEIAFGPGCWLWDYLRRSGASGFLLPLSGGADSSSVAAIVGCMCQLVVKEIANGDEQVKADAIRIGRYANGEFPTESREFAKRIFYTVFMGSENSSQETRMRAKKLADEIGSWHLDVSIDTVVSAFLSLFQTLTGKRPRYKVDGGSNVENLGLQNIQARIRMVLAFMLASLLPWVHNKQGFYLVLGSSNVDEGLRGYLTKNLCYRWGARLTPSEVAEKVKHFFKYYSINRHKMTVLTPSYHAESYSPEDNRFDLRQFLYNARWPYQFRKIDELVKELDGEKVPFGESSDHEKMGTTLDGGGGMGVIAAGSGNPKAGH
ncbi:glutamine-dependent NAD(+) synthetase [Citrus sinensis]|uniref:Glutamine-dependent NAD(+) synthetase n=2 Tax=Citrus sinensis TaxID=2711 RepID=A0ACB8JN65_CITSI|nr:glutamine-dependent NAD(+) synthetase [Citrus sinensis]KAH9718271.1 glutamine-dependent NAD(+) synthetase [Citrus sinensis]